MSSEMTCIILCTVLMMEPLLSEPAVHFHTIHYEKIASPYRDEVRKQVTALAQQKMVSLIACTILSIQERECITYEYKRSKSSCITYRIFKASHGNTIPVTPSSSAEIYFPIGRNCPSDFRYNLKLNLCFKLIHTLLTWTNAQGDCSKYGQDGRLIILDDNKKYHAVQKYIQEPNQDSSIGKAVFVGGTCKSRWCKWANGRVVNEYLWGPGQPDDSGECICMWKPYGYYFDNVNCDWPCIFVCEVPMR